MVLAGQEPPAAYYEQPDIEPHCEMYWLAFLDLTTERQLSTVIGPIPRSKIRQYGIDELDLGTDALDRFCAILARVDDDYGEMVNPKSGKDRPGNLRAEASMKDPAAVSNLLRGLSKGKPKKIPRNRNASE